MSKKSLIRKGQKLLKTVRDTIPWVISNKKTLLALGLTLVASIISPSVVGNVDSGVEVSH